MRSHGDYGISRRSRSRPSRARELKRNETYYLPRLILFYPSRVDAAPAATHAVSGQ